MKKEKSTARILCDFELSSMNSYQNMISVIFFHEANLHKKILPTKDFSSYF